MERIALRGLLPASGRRLIEVGAGYGRLADLYGNFEHVILSDRALSMMQQARQRLGHDPRFRFVVADVYALPFRAQAADQVVSVRVLHHLVDVSKALREVARVLTRDGHYLTEFASKRHIKAILRYLLRRQSENPFSSRPHEFVRLNFDFHPRWMESELRQAGFQVQARRAVSHFRWALLKKIVPLSLLVAADRALQRVGAWWPWTPSVFVQSQKHE